MGFNKYREGKLSPGSCGFFELDLDPVDSDVALLYKFSFVDHTVDKDKLIEFKKIKSDNSTIVRTCVTEYSGTISLDDIENKNHPVIRMDFCYPDNGEQEPIMEDNMNLDDFLLLTFLRINI